MTDHQTHQHLSAERIQAFLEGELPFREAGALEEHASSCARCQEELEAWRFLFSELRELPRVAPAADFQKRVLEQIRVRPSVLERLRSWLGRLRAAGAGRAAHLSPEALQDFVDGLLPARQLARVRAHVEECDRCRRQEAAWRRLITGLEDLPRMKPLPGFAQRVMARVELPEPVRTPAGTSLWERALAGGVAWLDALRPAAGSALALARELRPRTRRAWTVVGGLAAAPVAAAGALALYVATNPLLSVGNVATFFWWKASEMTLALGRGLAAGLLDSPMLGQAYALLSQVTGSASILAGTAGAFSVLTILSLYVLYRNLIATRPVEQPYVHFSF